MAVATHESATVQSPIISIENQGKLQGDSRDGVAHFLNIPFAAPPTGSLRWKPPQPPKPWSGLRKNPAMLSRCSQPKSPIDFEGPAVEGCGYVNTEDCLVLNVFTPEKAIPSLEIEQNAQVDPLPIIFYIHGGSGKFGSCHAASLSGRELAKSQNVCYIACNYRLGVLGLLAHPELSAEDDASDDNNGSGNYAILDLVAALKWVQKHARSFGGNPGNITIWGLSTGSQFVGCLLVSPAAQGLFHRAMMQSCVDLGNVRKLQSSTDIWMEKTAEEWGSEFGIKLGFAKGNGQLAGLRSLGVDAIVDATMDESAADCYEPAVDRRRGEGQSLGSSRPLASLEALEVGAFHKVPLIIGSTEEDGLGKMELEHTLFKATDVTDSKGLEHLLDREFGNASAEAQSHYPHHSTLARPVSLDAKQVENVLADFSKDIWYDAATVLMADKVTSTSGGPPVFLYFFTEKVKDPMLPDRAPASFHGADQQLWNGLTPHTATTGLSTTMMAYLGNFARSGDPNGSGLPLWETHMEGSAKCMELGPGLGMMERSKEFRSRYTFFAREYFSKRVLSELKRGEGKQRKKRPASTL